MFEVGPAILNAVAFHIRNIPFFFSNSDKICRPLPVPEAFCCRLFAVLKIAISELWINTLFYSITPSSVLYIRLLKYNNKTASLLCFTTYLSQQLQWQCRLFVHPCYSLNFNISQNSSVMCWVFPPRWSIVLSQSSTCSSLQWSCPHPYACLAESHMCLLSSCAMIESLSLRSSLITGTIKGH